MKIGIAYPQIELRGDPAALLKYALEAERLGLEQLLAYDHPLGAQHANRDPKLTGPYTEADPFHDPLMMFAYLAGQTTRLQFASGVMVLPQRQTALVARQVADLALLSGGRFTLGVGPGWNYVEYQALGADFHTRGKKLNEQIRLLRLLWSGEVVDFSGDFHRIDRAAINPAPRRQVPIYVGGFADAAFRRGAKLGDGFLFGNGYGDVFECLSRLEGYLAEEGRGSDPFGKHLILNNLPDIPAIVERSLAWRDRGGTGVSIEPMRRGLDSLEAHLDFMHAA
ncbi:MAG TPA: LLM class F420-dependent oxidoreductase, partial [Novosphingobium sp.]